MAAALAAHTQKTVLKPTTRQIVLKLARYVPWQKTTRFTQLQTGRTSARFHPLVFLAIVAYLEDQQKQGGNLATEALNTGISRLYARALIDISTSKLAEEGVPQDLTNASVKQFATVVNGGAHGAMFHLAMAAYFSLIDEPIQYLDKYRTVTYFSDEMDRDDFYNSFGNATELIRLKYFRVVDVVLGGNSASGQPIEEEWVELKSLQRRSPNERYVTLADGFKPYGKGPTYGYGKQGYHRQFVRDWAALNVSDKYTLAWTTQKDNPNTGSTSKSLYPIKITNFKWLFHDFDVKYTPKKGAAEIREQSPELNNTEKRGIRMLLTTIPKYSSGGLWTSQELIATHLPVTKKNNYQSVATRNSLKARIVSATPVQLVLNPLINAGAVDPDFVTELVNDGVL